MTFAGWQVIRGLVDEDRWWRCYLELTFLRGSPTSSDCRWWVPLARRCFIMTVLCVHITLTPVQEWKWRHNIKVVFCWMSCEPKGSNQMTAGSILLEKFWNVGDYYHYLPPSILATHYYFIVEVSFIYQNHMRSNLNDSICMQSGR